MRIKREILHRFIVYLPSVQTPDALVLRFRFLADDRYRRAEMCFHLLNALLNLTYNVSGSPVARSPYVSRTLFFRLVLGWTDGDEELS